MGATEKFFQYMSRAAIIISQEEHRGRIANADFYLFCFLLGFDPCDRTFDNKNRGQTEKVLRSLVVSLDWKCLYKGSASAC